MSVSDEYNAVKNELESQMEHLGARVISFQKLDEKNMIVLAQKDAPFGPDHGYITWHHGWAGLNTGHYDMTREQGFEDFNNRVERGY